MVFVFMDTRLFHSASERRRIPNCYSKTRHGGGYGVLLPLSKDQVNKVPQFLEAHAISSFLFPPFNLILNWLRKHYQPASINAFQILSYADHGYHSISLSHAKSYIEASCLVWLSGSWYAFFLKISATSSSLTNKVYLFSISESLVYHRYQIIWSDWLYIL